MALFSAMFVGALLGQLLVAMILHTILRKLRVNSLLLVAVVTVAFSITVSNYNHPAPYGEFNWLQDIAYVLAIIPVYFYLKRKAKGTLIASPSSHDRDAIAHAFGRPFIQALKQAPTQEGPRLTQPDRRNQPVAADDLWGLFRRVPDVAKAAIVLPVLFTAFFFYSILTAPTFQSSDAWMVAGIDIILAVIGIAVMLTVKLVLLFNKWLNDRLRA